jgi:hypothetical protein
MDSLKPMNIPDDLRKGLLEHLRVVTE